MNDTDSDYLGNENVEEPKNPIPKLYIVKIYPLDNKPVSESEYWVALAQIEHEVHARLFLRDGQSHTLISFERAMSLLSAENQLDLSMTLRLKSNKGGSATTIGQNSIERIDYVVPKIVRNYSLQKSIQHAHRLRVVGASAGCIHIGASAYHTKFSDIDRMIITASNSQFVIASMVQSAQLKGWGAIKVTGTEYFKRQVWMEAAARGIYIEGYIHTESDRQELLRRIPEAMRGNIANEYKPLQYQEKTAKVMYLEKQARRNKAIKLIQQNVDLYGLSEEELNFLLTRVEQNEHNQQRFNTHESLHRQGKENFPQHVGNIDQKNDTMVRPDTYLATSDIKVPSLRDAGKRVISSHQDTGHQISHLEQTESSAKHVISHDTIMHRNDKEKDLSHTSAKSLSLHQHTILLEQEKPESKVAEDIPNEPEI